MQEGSLEWRFRTKYWSLAVTCLQYRLLSTFFDKSDTLSYCSSRNTTGRRCKRCGRSQQQCEGYERPRCTSDHRNDSSRDPAYCSLIEVWELKPIPPFPEVYN
jgi:hypothetical protein